jgi:hypothetical protein
MTTVGTVRQARRQRLMIRRRVLIFFLMKYLWKRRTVGSMSHR